MYVCIVVYVHVHVYIHTIYTCVCVYVCMCVSMYVYVRVYDLKMVQRVLAREEGGFCWRGRGGTYINL